MSWSSSILTRSIPWICRVREFTDLTHVHNTVESGHYLHRCANWSIPWWGEQWNQVGYSILAKAKTWSGEDRQPHQSTVKTEQLCRAWWRPKVSFVGPEWHTHHKTAWGMSSPKTSSLIIAKSVFSEHSWKGSYRVSTASIIVISIHNEVYSLAG